jgi:hypothetical protein
LQSISCYNWWLFAHMLVFILYWFVWGTCGFCIYIYLQLVAWIMDGVESWNKMKSMSNLGNWKLWKLVIFSLFCFVILLQKFDVYHGLHKVGSIGLLEWLKAPRNCDQSLNVGNKEDGSTLWNGKKKEDILKSIVYFLEVKQVHHSSVEVKNKIARLKNSYVMQWISCTQ